MNRILLAACVIAASTTTQTASAEQPFTSDSGQLFGSLGYGVWTADNIWHDADSYGVGLAVGGGRTLGFDLYLGARFDYHFGTTQEHASVTRSTRMHELGLVLGYDFGVTRELVVRPQVGVVYAEATSEVDLMEDGGSSRTEFAFAVSPGVIALMNMGNWHLRCETRYKRARFDEWWTVSGLLIGIGAGVLF